MDEFEKYFVLDKRSGIWRALLPVGKGWHYFAEYPAMQSLTAWAGKPLYLFSAFAICAFVGGVLLPHLPLVSAIIAFLASGFGWSLSASLEAEFLNRERLGEPISPVAQLFLKTQVTRLAFVITGVGVVGAAIGGLGS